MANAKLPAARPNSVGTVDRLFANLNRQSPMELLINRVLPLRAQLNLQRKGPTALNARGEFRAFAHSPQNPRNLTTQGCSKNQL